MPRTTGEPNDRTRRLAVVIGLAAGLVLVTIPAATAHSGNGGGISHRYLQAETYDAPDDRCDPDFHDEHTFARDGAVFLPHSGCGLNWDGVTTSGSTCAPDAMRVAPANSQSPTVYEVRVEHAGETIATGEALLYRGGWTTIDLDAEYAFWLGVSNPVRVDYRIPDGSSGGLRIDWVDYGTGCVLNAS